MLRDRVEYSRAHCVWWFVSVDPNHADVACPCGVLERRVVACRTLDELRDQCLVGRAAVEVSIHANPPPTDQPGPGKPGSVHIGQVQRRRSPADRQPAMTAGSPSGPGSRNRTTAEPDCVLASNGAAQRLCGVLDVVLAVVDSGHRDDVACDAATMRRRQWRSESAPAESPGVDPLPERGATSSRAARTSPRGPVESAPWRCRERLRSQQRFRAGHTNVIGTGLITVQSRLRRGYLEASPR